MNVTLKQQDVEKAIALYLSSMGVTATVSSVEFKAGRKGKGLMTWVELTDTQHTEIPSQPVSDSVRAHVDSQPTQPTTEASEPVSEASEELPAEEPEEETETQSLFG